MNTTRRDLLKFAGGSMAGVLFTPAPWRLITDTALWSENWPGIPHPPRGESRTALSRCSLCPAGCAVRARCVGERPVSLAGIEGGLCVFGVAGHHLPYHPGRARDLAGGKDRVIAAIAACAAGKSVAVLDLQPGRTASWTHRRAMASLPNGVYLAPPLPAVSVDLGAARSVLSLGAPLLDGWIAPSRAFAVRERIHLVQAEPFESRTAALADRWMPTLPGHEDAALAEFFRAHAEPALVIDGPMSRAALAANLALGAWGVTLFPRSEAPVPTSWQHVAPSRSLEDVPDESIQVLLIDRPLPVETIAWSRIQKKLAPHATVAELGFQRHETIGLAAAVYPEALGDPAQPVDSPAPLFRLSTPLAPAQAPSAAEVVAELAGLPRGDALRERADAIHASGLGRLCAVNSLPVAIKDISADDFWKGLQAGACWRGDVPPAGPAPRVDSPGRVAPAYDLTAIAAESGVDASPLLSKVYRESSLRLAAGVIALHPSCGLRDGARARLITDAGERPVKIALDPGVAPGVVLTGVPELAGSRAKVVQV